MNNQLLICERIFNKVKNQLNTSHFGDIALKLCPKLKCPKYKCPKFLVFNVFMHADGIEIPTNTLFCQVFLFSPHLRGGFVSDSDNY